MLSILLKVQKSLKIIARSKFLIPKYTLSKQTSSISLVSKTKKGNSERATKQFLVGLILTRVFPGLPQNYKLSSGISTSIYVRFAWLCYSISFANPKNFELRRLRAYLSASSYSSSSMSLRLWRPPPKLISSAATPDSLQN